MERTKELERLRDDGLALADAAEAAGLAATVEACPGWSVADLVWHMCEVHWYHATVVAQRLTDRRSLVRRDRPADADLVATYREGVAILHAALDTAEDDLRVPTFFGSQPTSWVRRRMMQETAMHRWDAERAAGHDWSIDADVAIDGIDEFLAHMIHDVADGAPPLDGTVHIHTTDDDSTGAHGEWMIATRDDGAYFVTRVHDKGSCAIRGAAGDILLVLWRRMPLSTVEVLGDPTVAERFVARTSA